MERVKIERNKNGMEWNGMDKQRDVLSFRTVCCLIDLFKEV